jgi:hypothetical protein
MTLESRKDGPRWPPPPENLLTVTPAGTVLAGTAPVFVCWFTAQGRTPEQTLAVLQGDGYRLTPDQLGAALRWAVEREGMRR